MVAVARFAGVVDVPLFSAPDLRITDYVGFDASPSFAPHCRVPLFTYQPQSRVTDKSRLNRMVSIIPNINEASEALLNPTQVLDMTGMSFRAQWIDGCLYTLNAMDAAGVNYRWFVSRTSQSRVAGTEDPITNSRWYIDQLHPFVGFGQPRIEFTHPFLPGFDWPYLSNVPMAPYTWNNAYSRVYFMLMSVYGLKCRNGFNCQTLPGNTWLNVISGSTTAFCRNASTNSFAFGIENRTFFGSGFGAGHFNYMFVSKGVKSNAMVVNFKTDDYNPDTIDGMEPRWDYVTFDNPVYAAALDGLTDAQGYKAGFIFTLLTNGNGVTGERQEILVVDPIFSTYYVLRFVPQNAHAQQAMKTLTTRWSVKIDTEGTVWFYNGGSPGFKNSLFNSFSPALFFNPTIIDFDLPAITLPCYNTCLPGYM